MSAFWTRPNNRSLVELHYLAWEAFGTVPNSHFSGIKFPDRIASSFFGHIRFIKKSRNSCAYKVEEVVTIEFNIFPERGLVVVQYSGYVTLNDTLSATKAYVSHPEYAVGQKQLVDMSGIIGFEKDYVQFMKMQAGKAERLAHSGLQSLVVYISPTAISRELSAMFIRSWIDVDAVVQLVQHSETEALALMGQSEETIDVLLATLAK